MKAAESPAEYAQGEFPGHCWRSSTLTIASSEYHRCRASRAVGPFRLGLYSDLPKTSELNIPWYRQLMVQKEWGQLAMAAFEAWQQDAARVRSACRQFLKLWLCTQRTQSALRMFHSSQLELRMRVRAASPRNRLSGKQQVQLGQLPLGKQDCTSLVKLNMFWQAWSSRGPALPLRGKNRPESTTAVAFPPTRLVMLSAHSPTATPPALVPDTVTLPFNQPSFQRQASTARVLADPLMNNSVPSTRKELFRKPWCMVPSQQRMKTFRWRQKVGLTWESLLKIWRRSFILEQLQGSYLDEPRRVEDRSRQAWRARLMVGRMQVPPPWKQMSVSWQPVSSRQRGG